MTSINVEADIQEQIAVLDEAKWTALQIDVCMSVANAKHLAFICEADRLAKLVRSGVLSRGDAADCLHNAANYNSLYFEYGTDNIQDVLAAAFDYFTRAA
jgi:hypothetical protein